MKKTAAQRLSEALSALQMRNYNYCHEMVSSRMRIGICIASRKKVSSQKPTKDALSQLQQKAKSHFASQNIDEFYFTFVELPIHLNEEVNANATLTVDDFLLTYRIQEFDTTWEQETIARSLIYCPSELEAGGWHDWFIPEIEAIRLAPLCYEWLKEHKIAGQIQQEMQQPAISFLDTFIQKYILTDYNLELSERDRKLVSQGLQDWKPFYKVLISILPSKETTLYELYKASRAKIVQSRNEKLRSVLQAFSDEVEKEVIISKPLAQDVKESYIQYLHGTEKRAKREYEAKRPVYCLSDDECARTLYLVIRQFQADPKKNQIYGEIALFIWICQQAASRGHELDIKAVLDLKVTDMDFDDFCVRFPHAKIEITEGLSTIIHEFIGDMPRQNERKLFPSLTYDNLEKSLKNLTKKFFGREGYLLPRDFLTKVHAIPGARIPYELRVQLAYQKSRISNSPYILKASEIKKQVRSSVEQNSPHDII